MCCQLKSCCCGCTVRTGSGVSAAYSIILGLFRLGYCVWAIKRVDFLDDSQSIGDELHDDEDSYGTVSRGLYIGQAVFESALLLAAILLVIGLGKKMTCLLMPWIVVIWIETIILCMKIILVFVLLGAYPSDFENSDLWSILSGGIFIALNIYCALCVSSYRRGLLMSRHRALPQDDATQPPEVNNTVLIVMSGDDNVHNANLAEKREMEADMPPPYDACYMQQDRYNKV